MKHCKFMVAAFAACMVAGGVEGAVRAWTGGGSDDNFSTPANWADGIAPQNGDTLVFMGDVRTSPVNDYDPENYVFAGVVFSNNSAACSAPFTVKGNKLRIKSGSSGCVAGVTKNFSVYPMSATGVTITDTFETDVDLTDNGNIGSETGSNHNLVFKGTLTGNGGVFYTQTQYRSRVTCEGPIKNFSNVKRPNGGGGSVWLLSNDNEFSSDQRHELSEGTLKVAGVGAFGGSSRAIRMGQNAYNTPGYLVVAAEEDTYFDGDIVVEGPRPTVMGGTVTSDIAGKTVTLAGKVTCVVAGKDPGDGLAVGFQLNGIGDGVFAGNIAAQNLWLQKSDSGTWRFSETSSCVSTGELTVAGGTLLVDGDYSTMKNVNVSSGAKLGGTGRVSRASFKNGSTYMLHVGEDGFEPLHIDGAIEVNGTVAVAIDAAKTFEPGQAYTLFSYEELTGDGTFVAGDGLPGTANLYLENNALKFMISSSELIWKGDAANNVWDMTTPNWFNDSVFANNTGVTFDDTSDEGTEVVSITAPVSPITMRVRGNNRNYTFTGAGITGVGSVDKFSGNSVLTFANTNTYTGTTTINSGAFVLEGTLDGSTLIVGANGAFTNTVTGRITGAGKVSIDGAPCELSGTNDFTGGLSIKAPNYAENDIKCVVRDLSALGAGDFDFTYGSMKFVGTSGAIGRGKTLRTGKNGSTLMLTAGDDSTFTWLGDVEFSGQFALRPGGVMKFGEPGCSTVVRSSNSGSVYVRNASWIYWYSRIETSGPYYQTDANVAHFYAPGNKWQLIQAQVGGLVCHCTNTLAVAEVKMGQIYEEYAFHPYLDLNGFDQTISALTMNESLEKSSQTVKSELPAVLTITNDANIVTLRKSGRITGAVTLRKTGAGNWSFGCRNQSTGDVIVEGGTMTVTADDSLPTASETSCLRILSGAKVALADGVNATVSRLSSGGESDLPAGVYGGEGCAVAGAKIKPALFASGTGSLRVLHGAGGTVLIIR